jgi:uncharacterized protein YozE (UPF0346 family)
MLWKPKGEIMKTNKITNLPWKVRNEKSFGVWIESTTERVSNNRGPDYARQILEDDEYPKKLADAEFIVRAVNAHASLVDALERILYAHDTGNNGASIGEAVLCREYAERARVALACAKGEA